MPLAMLKSGPLDLYDHRRSWRATAARTLTPGVGRQPRLSAFCTSEPAVEVFLIDDG
jgi:hypothetical protein